MHYLYILQSVRTKRCYIGSTANFEIRLKQHNAGQTKSTKPYRPWKIIYTEEYKTRTEAAKREWLLKHPRGYLEKIEIVKKFGEVA